VDGSERHDTSAFDREQYDREQSQPGENALRCANYRL
jgi:hypothetical protein